MKIDGLRNKKGRYRWLTISKESEHILSDKGEKMNI